MSLASNVFPDVWKLAKVKPLAKSSSIEGYKDVRPISLLPVASKLVERAVCAQLTTYLESNGILPSTQSGFRSGRGTDTALAHVTDDVLSESDAGKSTVLVLLDFSRAFDCINVDLLLAKMAYYGISPSARDWFASYLTQRKQYVVTQNAKGEETSSAVGDVKRGTPQGSVVSPLFFILYTADLCKIIKNCKVHLYADDTQIYFSFYPNETKSAMELINQDLAAVSEWARKNNLVLNPSKSKYIILGSKHQRELVISHEPEIHIEGAAVERVVKAKNLGLLLDCDLRYIDHINMKIRNAFYRLKVLYGLRECLSERVRITLVESLVLSQFNYCDTVYGPRLFAKTSHAIQRVQNACARFCFAIPKRARITPFLNEKRILKMAGRRELHLACLVQKVIRTGRPGYLFDKVAFDQRNRPTRSHLLNRLVVCQHKTASYRGSFKYSAAKIWNDLPPPLRQSISQPAFRARVKTIILRKQIAKE